MPSARDNALKKGCPGLLLPGLQAVKMIDMIYVVNAKYLITKKAIVSE